MFLSGDFGKIEVAIESRSSSNDYWDGNWLNCYISITISNFKAEYHCNLRTDEFLVFSQRLNALKKNAIEEALFSTMEEGLLLILRKDLTGNYLLKGEAKNNDNYMLKFVFEIYIDETQFAQFQISVLEILKKYPVIGSSN